MKSRLYQGQLRHRRFSPRGHSFAYRVYMPYLHLDELPQLISQGGPLSQSRLAPLRFRRADYLGDPDQSLKHAVWQRIAREGLRPPRGPVYLLGNLRCFGYNINPLACYYCFDEDESHLEYIVAEVTNTPWRESHSYVIPAATAGGVVESRFPKALHVSPFNHMDMEYRWRCNVPGERLTIHLENHDAGGRLFDATLDMSGRPLTRAALNRVLLRFPFMTARVAAAIYWQALLLFLKQAPFYPHPDRDTRSSS